MDLTHYLEVAGQLLAVLVGLISLLGTVRNGLTHLGWISTETSTRFGGLLDRASWVAEKGKTGLLAAATLPGFASKPKAELPPAPPMRGDAGRINTSLLFFVAQVAAVALAIAAFAIVVAAISGCAGTRAPIYETMATATRATSQASMALPGACEKVQMAEVAASTSADAARARVLTVDRRCRAAEKAIGAAGAALKAGADGLNDADQALVDPKSALKWALGALDAYRNLRAMLAPLGVQMPAVGF